LLLDVRAREGLDSVGAIALVRRSKRELRVEDSRFEREQRRALVALPLDPQPHPLALVARCHASRLLRPRLAPGNTPSVAENPSQPSQHSVDPAAHSTRPSPVVTVAPRVRP